MTSEQTAGEVVRQYRETKKLSQDDVAAELGLTEGAVSQWETGRTAPRRKTAIRLDALLEAGGSIVRAFGYAMPSTSAVPPDAVRALKEELSQLRSRVAALESEQSPLDE